MLVWCLLIALTSCTLPEPSISHSLVYRTWPITDVYIPRSGLHGKAWRVASQESVFFLCNHHDFDIFLFYLNTAFKFYLLLDYNGTHYDGKCEGT